jgi:hypothetical protein
MPDPFEKAQEADKVQQKALDEIQDLFAQKQELEKADSDLPPKLEQRFETLFEVIEPRDANNN